MTEASEETSVVEIFSVLDEHGTPNSIGGWTWRYVSYPSHAIHAFGPPPFATKEEAEEDAKNSYSDTEQVILE